jgi:hypothetical protein
MQFGLRLSYLAARLQSGWPYPAPPRPARAPLRQRAGDLLDQSARLGPRRHLARAGLSLSADIHLNVLNNSYDRMYLRARFSGDGH